MSLVISFLNQKGGVGKTTLSINVAACLNMLGQKVLLIDLDPQANLTLALGFEPGKTEHTSGDILLDDRRDVAVGVAGVLEEGAHLSRGEHHDEDRDGDGRERHDR